MNDIDITKKIIESIKKSFRVEIAYDLGCEFNKVLSLNDVSFEKFKNLFKNNSSFNRIRDFDGITKSEFLILVLNEEPFILLNVILPYIKDRQVFKEITSINTKDDYKKHEFSIYDDLNIDGFSIITDVDEPIVIDESESWIGNVVKFQIKYCDLFDKKVYFEGNFVRENNISAWDIEEAGLKLMCNVFGVFEDESIPAFIEYLLEACLNVKYKNNKMAFFNLFASFDNFIELLYEKTFEFFINNYSSYKEYLKEQITDELREKEVSNYEAVFNDIFNTIDLYLKKKIRNFANQNRRLIDEKLISVLKEVDIHKNKDYANFNKIVSELKEIEIKRNSIAHGEKVEIKENIGEIMYKILTVMFSIIYEQDFSLNEWNEILVNED